MCSLRSPLARRRNFQADGGNWSRAEHEVCHHSEEVGLYKEGSSSSFALSPCVLRSHSGEVEPYAESDNEEQTRHL